MTTISVVLFCKRPNEEKENRLTTSITEIAQGYDLLMKLALILDQPFSDKLLPQQTGNSSGSYKVQSISFRDDNEERRPLEINVQFIERPDNDNFDYQFTLSILPVKRQIQSIRFYKVQRKEVIMIIESDLFRRFVCKELSLGECRFDIREFSPENEEIILSLNSS